MRRRTARRAYSRRRNQGFVGALPKALQPIGRAVVPGLLGAGGLALSRWTGNYLAGMMPDYQAANPRASSLIAGAVTLGVAGMVIPRIKALQPAVRNAILVGFAIDFGLRILGALLPETSPWRNNLIGLPGAAGFGYAGFGQPDIYQAGMLGENAYNYQYSPVQGGVGAYIADPSALVPGRKEFEVEVSGYSGGVGAVGAYVADPQALRTGPGAGPELPVEIAPAGFGAYVADPQALRTGPGAGPELPVEIAPAGWGGFGGLDDTGLTDDDLAEVALDVAEAGAEGLGTVHRSLEAQGGRLLYSTPEGSANLAKKGYDVQMVKNSAQRHPGVAIVAATRSGRTYQCPHCAQHGQAPSGSPIFRCWSCAQAITVPGTAPRRQTQKGAAPAMAGPPGPAGTFQPLYAPGV